MATVTYRRSDLWPVGTLVKAFTGRPKGEGGKPSGTETTNGTVDAAGVLTLTLPAKTPITLYAEVASSHRYVMAGDPTSDAPLPKLSERLARQRAASGAAVGGSGR